VVEPLGREGYSETMAKVMASQDAKTLPRFIDPMQPKLGVPFDSDEHLFEVKWDGTRNGCRSWHQEYRSSEFERWRWSIETGQLRSLLL
jgi:hypothetical protein